MNTQTGRWLVVSAIVKLEAKFTSTTRFRNAPARLTEEARKRAATDTAANRNETQNEKMMTQKMAMALKKRREKMEEATNMLDRVSKRLEATGELNGNGKTKQQEVENWNRSNLFPAPAKKNPQTTNDGKHTTNGEWTTGKPEQQT